MVERERGPGEPVPSETTRLLRDLLDVGGLLRPVVARRAGLSATELSALDHLSRGPLGPAEVARLLEVSTAAATGIVDRLAERGHAERRPHPGDRRRVDVRLTASGRGEILEHLGPMFTELVALEASFDEAELAVVERYLRGAVRALEAVVHPAGRGSPAGRDEGGPAAHGRRS